MAGKLIFNGWHQDPNNGTLKAVFLFATPIIRKPRKGGLKTEVKRGVTLDEEQVRTVAETDKNTCLYEGEILTLTPEDIKIVKKAYNDKPRAGEGGPV